MSLSLQPKPLKYHQIAAELRAEAARLPAGTRLPAERDLAERFGCNVLTVRKGLLALVAEGVISRRTGSGTFVCASETVPAVRPVARAPEHDRVGLLVYTETGAYGHRVLQAIGRMAETAGIELRTGWVQDFGAPAQAQARVLAAAGCAALVLPWFPHHLTAAAADFVRACPLPVSLPLLIPGLERNCFERPDRFGTSTLACTAAICHYFQRLGHRRIALLGPDIPSDPILQAKLSAYSCAMSRAGLPQLCGLIGPTAGAADALAARWQEYRGDLAIVSYDDTHALRLVTAMHKLGLAAPHDFAIVGFNNIEASGFSDPPLSTLDQDFDYLGRALLRSARALGRGEVEQAGEPPPHRLLVRASCGGANRVDAALAAELAKLGLTVTPAATPAREAVASQP